MLILNFGNPTSNSCSVTPKNNFCAKRTDDKNFIGQIVYENFKRVFRETSSFKSA